MGKVVLTNGIEIPDLCLGTGIVYGYGDGRRDPYHVAGHWVKSLFKNRKRLKSDYALPGVINVAMTHSCSAFDTSRAYGGGRVCLGEDIEEVQTARLFYCNKDVQCRSV